MQQQFAKREISTAETEKCYKEKMLVGYTLAAYGSNAFQEFILPQTDNADYSVTLSKTNYGINEDIRLNFEIIDGTWRFVSLSKNARLRSGSLQFGEVLEIGSMIQLRQKDATVSLLVMELDQNLTRFQKFYIHQPGQLKIGAAEDCHIIYDFQGLISRHHATLELDTGYCRIIDNSRNGIYMAGQRIHAGQELAFGDVVNIFGLQIIWLGLVVAVGTTGQPMQVCAPILRPLKGSSELYPNGYRQLTSPSRHMFHRSPRILPQLNTETIEIEAVPQPTQLSQRPLFLQIGPAMTMVIPMLLGTLVALIASSSSGYGISPYMYTGIVIAAASAVLGVMWGLINMRHAKKDHAEAEENRSMRYQAYLYGVEQDIMTKVEENRKILEGAYPSASTCAEWDAYCPTLWSRNTSHSDVLFVRLGLGDVPFQCQIKVPKKTFTLYDDALSELPKQIRDRYRTLHNVPVGIDLQRRQLVGVVGDGKASAAAGIARTIALQIAANNCYTDVKLVFIGKAQLLASGGDWGFAKWLPHVWSESKVTRFCASTQAEITEICFELSEVIRVRAELAEHPSEEGLPLPYYIIFLENLELLQNEGIVKHLLDPLPCYGISTVILAHSRELLPNVCEDVIEGRGGKGLIYNLGAGIVSGTEVTFDTVTAQAAEKFARKIASVEVSEIETGGAIPDNLTFLDMWKVKTVTELNVLERWRKNRTYDTMRALIGQKAGGGDCFLDIHEKHHGPHGLVAGTTGSGKSETLQTYMLSMAVNYSPDDIAFFVIDYKGGGMANLFGNLPHMAGQITNLSGNQVHRAMVSIKSENRRRQRLLNECGVNHIDSYTRLYKNGETSVPLPHLLIIIDEFAELKKEEGPFMRELISVAQVGRSLGVHLILATQKPDGTVDDNIRCNAKFRICLRVQDRQDSNEMLHRPDAAYITQAGRAFMQVGNDEVFEEFQSGWSGAEYDETLASGNVSIASMRTITGKPVIVGNHLKKQQKDRQRRQWLMQMAELYLQAAEEMGTSLTLAVGDRVKLSQLIDRVFDRLEKERVDYPRGKANDQRLREFAQVFAQFVHKNWHSNEVLLQILQQMQQENKKLPELKGKSQLAATVDYIAALAEKNGYVNSFRLWLPVLPEQLPLQQLAGYSDGQFDGAAWMENAQAWSLEAMIGLSDNPANQMQNPFVLSFSENGNLAICGVAGSGKSTFLQTLLYSMADHYSPSWLNFYVLDYSNKSLAPFEDAPHCGGVVYEDDQEKVGRLFKMLEGMIKERKTLLRGGSYSQFVQHNGTQVPAVLLVIDNYASFKEKTNGAYEASLLSISREGANYGVFLAITSGGFGGAEIPNRIADNLRSTVCLEMGDKFKYGDVLRNIHFDVMPEPGVKGRGIATIQGTILEYQTATAVSEQDDYRRATKIRKRFAEMDVAWKGKRARRIPEIPDKPKLSHLMEMEEYAKAIQNPMELPFAYLMEDASLYSLDLRNTYCYLITGKAHTGKTTAVQVLAEGAARKNGQLCLMDLGTGSLRPLHDRLKSTYVTDGQSFFAYTKHLQQTFLQRNKDKQAMIREGADEDEIFLRMAERYTPVFIFIDDLGAFMHHVYQPQEGFGGTASFYENIIEKGSLHHIYFIAAVNTDAMAQLSGRKVFAYMAAYKTGLHLGGNVAAQKVLDFSALPFMEQNKPLKTGIGLVPQDMDHPAPRKIVIPKAKG